MRWTWPCYVDCLGRGGVSATRWIRDLPEEMGSGQSQLAFQADWRGSVGIEDLDLGGIDGPVAGLACATGKCGGLGEV